MTSKWMTLAALAALAAWILLCPACSGDDTSPGDDDDTTAAGDDDDDTTPTGDDDDSAGDDDDAAAEEVATPQGGMPVGTAGVQVGLRAQADNGGEPLVSAPAEVTLTEPVSTLTAPVAVDEAAGAAKIHAIRDLVAGEVSP